MAVIFLLVFIALPGDASGVFGKMAPILQEILTNRYQGMRRHFPPSSKWRRGDLVRFFLMISHPADFSTALRLLPDYFNKLFTATDTCLRQRNHGFLSDRMIAKKKDVTGKEISQKTLAGRRFVL